MRSVYASLTRSSAGPRPAAPFNVSVQQIGPSLMIKWNASRHSASVPVDHYVIQYRTVGQWVPLSSNVPANQTWYLWGTASRTWYLWAARRHRPGGVTDLVPLGHSITDLVPVGGTASQTWYLWGTASRGALYHFRVFVVGKQAHSDASKVVSLRTGGRTKLFAFSSVYNYV